jgi:hypothetical protein
VVLSARLRTWTLAHRERACWTALSMLYEVAQRLVRRREREDFFNNFNYTKNTILCEVST